jgi:transposase
MMTAKKKPRTYTKEFQDNAVRLCKLPNRSVASVAVELRIPAWRLRNWVRDSKIQLERSEDVDEMIRLERENRRLKEENEILKKAAAYFAKNLA